ncbi:GNAT family N-acetyltransferase [Angustibacter sp. McL0619]|uniref:GNAT family N-acetyltransferase n=1 Tax=Angustibacter sp. McL0619 TaxID=3415676 RepID=UPI003CF40EF9
MSDLQCPATVLVLRHGQSAGNVSRRLSSAAPGGELTEQGRQQARDAAARLVDRNVARVYASPLLRAQQTAQIVAQVVGAGEVQVLDEVREFSLGECEGSETDEDWARVDGLFDAWLDGHLSHTLPGGESGLEVLSRVRAGLESVADQHRGETVVVVSHGGAMALALPLLAGDVRDDRARGSGVPNCGVVEMQGDADGWQLLAWPTRSPALGSDPHPGDLAELVDRADSERNLPPDGEPLPGSAYATVRGIACASLPIAQAWATQASVTGLGLTPSPGAVDEVTAWLDAHSPGAWHLVVGEHWAAEVTARHGLVELMRHGAWVCEEVPDVAADVVADVVAADGLELGPADSVEEFLSVFGVDLRPMVQGQLDAPDREFVVLRHEGAAVACARLRDLAGTTYVGGITVRPELRGRGWGLATSALATQRALQRSPIAWLHCEDEVSGLYSRLGYRRVTTHVHLGPAAG